MFTFCSQIRYEKFTIRLQIENTLRLEPQRSDAKLFKLDVRGGVYFGKKFFLKKFFYLV